MVRHPHSAVHHGSGDAGCSPQLRHRILSQTPMVSGLSTKTWSR